MAVPHAPAWEHKQWADDASSRAARQARPIGVDAGTQANEFLPQLRKLQLEAAELRLQLSRVTGMQALACMRAR